jgi:signal transduction histidine kinase
VTRLDGAGLGNAKGTAATNDGDVHGAGGNGADTEDDGRRAATRFLVRRLPSSSRRRMARRLLEARDAERKRIEQDLHDGVQQHLTALRIRLALAADRLRERGDVDASAVLEGFGDDVDHLITEVRELAHAVYPAILADYGLGAALRSAGLRSGLAVTVQASGVRRCRPEVELAVYFCCLAALDNAATHAGPGKISVCLSDMGSALHFEVSDAGAGFDPSRTPPGTGLLNMRDRVAAIGGTLTVESAPARGTRVLGSVPDPWLDDPA